ncbi:Hypothetical protein A7982_10426 [Minicystis rosea]|nr:Hypothetical protein A7982_10426 [Minicystis rosea]
MHASLRTSTAAVPGRYLGESRMDLRSGHRADACFVSLQSWIG